MLNRRDFLKLTSLSTIGVVAAKLGLPVPQALAQGGVAKSVPKPSGERIAGVAPVNWEPMLNDDFDAPVALSSRIAKQAQENMVDRLSIDKSMLIGAPVYLDAGGEVQIAPPGEHVGYISGRCSDDTVRVTLT